MLEKEIFKYLTLTTAVIKILSIIELSKLYCRLNVVYICCLDDLYIESINLPLLQLTNTCLMIKSSAFIVKINLKKLGQSWAKLSSSWGLKLEFEVEVWTCRCNCSLKLKFDIDVWIWRGNLKWKVDVWSWSLKFKLEVKVWSWRLKLKFEVEVWSWSFELKLGLGLSLAKLTLPSTYQCNRKEKFLRMPATFHNFYTTSFAESPESSFAPPPTLAKFQKGQMYH